MPLTAAPTLSELYQGLSAFIIAVTGLPQGSVIQGIQNRVAMPPKNPGFVVMTNLFQQRLATSVDDYDTTNPDPASLSITQSMRVDMQIDCYGPSAGDWAAAMTTLFRDQYGCNALAPFNCQPLYAEEARMMPLIDEESQYEQRWTWTATLQYNPTVIAPEQFADVANIDLIDVDVEYPPT